MDLPSSSHFIYIPGVLILGIVLGFIFGARTTREAFVLEAKRAEERAQRRAARAQQREQLPDQPGPTTEAAEAKPGKPE